jgi:hypothetical protein
MGDSPAVSLPAAATVNIAPPDVLDADGDPQSNPVDTNRVIITGSGTINSFGQACGGAVGEQGEKCTVTKKLTFQPTSGQTITLHHNPPTLTLLGGIDRNITVECFGEYQSDPSGNWQETQFYSSATSPVSARGGLQSLIYYNASATITIPPLATRAWIRMWGGAGGSAYYYSSGTGAPGYLEKWLTGIVPGNTLIFTRGNGGAPGDNSGSHYSGDNGTASILASGTQTIGTLTANGTLGVNYGDQNPSPGGTATGGDINLKGQGGFRQWQDTSPAVPVWRPGSGGMNTMCRGADGNDAAVTQNGNAGMNGGMCIFWFADTVM